MLSTRLLLSFHLFFFFNDTATTEIYTLSLHDALPISFSLWIRSSLIRLASSLIELLPNLEAWQRLLLEELLSLSQQLDRKSTRLNSSHQIISYAVFCLKKKKAALPLDSARDFATPGEP